MPAQVGGYLAAAPPLLLLLCAAELLNVQNPGRRPEGSCRGRACIHGGITAVLNSMHCPTWPPPNPATTDSILQCPSRGLFAARTCVA